jgi:hypothetical protein
MRIIFALLLPVGLSVAALSQTASKQIESANPPFKLEITANTDHSRVSGSEWDFVNNEATTRNAASIAGLGVAIRKTNVTDHEISKWSKAGCAAEVRDGTGASIKPRDFGTKPTDGLGGGEGMLRGTKDLVLQPGESKVKRDVIGDWYDMSLPGTYTIQLCEHVSDDPDSEIVKSNIITVTVLPAKR